MNLNEKSFEVLDKLDLAMVSDIARTKLIRDKKPNHYTESHWVARCWVEGVMSVMCSKGLVTLNDKQTTVG